MRHCPATVFHWRDFGGACLGSTMPPRSVVWKSIRFANHIDKIVPPPSLEVHLGSHSLQDSRASAAMLLSSMAWAKINSGNRIVIIMHLSFLWDRGANYVPASNLKEMAPPQLCASKPNTIAEAPGIFSGVRRKDVPTECMFFPRCAQCSP